MLPDPYRIFLGFDPSEIQAYNVAEMSLYRHAGRGRVTVTRLCALSLYPNYRRPTTTMPNGQLFDELSGAPMSTGHAIARFFVPFLCDYEGWAVFTDGDVLFRDDIANLFALADNRYAIQVVEHPPLLEEGVKKSGHIQQAYPRKNQSSVMLMNCGHPSNAALTLDVLNSWPGRDLHAFRWLQDAEIGTLRARWNHLVNVNPPTDDVAIAHFTLGVPALPGHADDPFADEWWMTSRMSGYRREEVIT